MLIVDWLMGLMCLWKRRCRISCAFSIFRNFYAILATIFALFLGRRQFWLVLNRLYGLGETYLDCSGPFRNGWNSRAQGTTQAPWATVRLCPSLLTYNVFKCAPKCTVSSARNLGFLSWFAVFGSRGAFLFQHFHESKIH